MAILSHLSLSRTGKDSLKARLAAMLESGADRLRNVIGGRSREDWEVGLQPYRCFGTRDQLRYSCRVLRDPGLARTTIHDSVWQNFKASYHRFESDEVPGATLKIVHDGAETEALSDEEGYCNGLLPLSGQAHHGWNSLRVSISKLPYGSVLTDGYDAECLVPSPHAKFGIISDIDDTVLHTQVNSRLKMVLWSAFGNSYSRLPLPGVARLYRRLAEVDREEEVNPVFYVSSSPWNLYPVLTEFIDAVDLPKGPLLLRDMGIGGGASMGSDHSHKEVNIASILDTYPDMRFILLGDSGEEDAAIYSRTIQRYPGRIHCAYIRDTGHVNRTMLDDSILRASKAGSELVLVPDSESIEKHARTHGWL